MTTSLAECTRLTLLVQRILDAETLSEAEGATLLGEAIAARLSLEEGDDHALRSHVERLVHSIALLLEEKALKPADGRSALQSAQRLLIPKTDTND